jgi:hypothetical protein
MLMGSRMVCRACRQLVAKRERRDTASVYWQPAPELFATATENAAASLQASRRR